MVDAEKHIEYWRKGSEEDWEVAHELLGSGRVRHSLFFAHLALEKVLKAHVCRQTQDIAPRIHRLDRLAEIAGISISPDHKRILVRMNDFNLKGRYPESLAILPTLAEARGYLAEAQEAYEWLMKQL